MQRISALHNCQTVIVLGEIKNQKPNKCDINE